MPDNSSLCDFPPCLEEDFVGDSNGQTFSEILGAIAEFINAATGFGSLFLSPDETGTNPPPAPPPSSGSKLNEWIKNNMTLFITGIVVVIGGIVIFIYRKRIFKKGSIVPKAV